MPISPFTTHLGLMSWLINLSYSYHRSYSCPMHISIQQTSELATCSHTYIHTYIHTRCSGTWYRNRSGLPLGELSVREKADQCNSCSNETVLESVDTYLVYDALIRDGKNHDFFKKIENIEIIENIGYFRYISAFFDVYPIHI